MAYKILIVDDEPDILQTLAGRLAREGYAVFCAADGNEALAQVKAADPDIIILDLMLPGLNGFQVLEAVRRDFSDRWRPVIIVSAKDDLETTRKCYTMEADHYLTKPCSIEVILKGIRTMISLIPGRAGHDHG